jgi:multiple sugar transport system substrate-binding protein
MKKGLICVLLVLFVFGGAFSVFASGSQGGGEAKAVTINWRMGSWWADAMPVIKEAFEAEHPNITVVTENIPFVGYLEKATASTVGPNPPDVMALTDIMMPVLVERGLLITLEEYQAKSEMIKEEFYFAGGWALNFYKGKMYAFSHRGDGNVLYYHVPMFKEAGLDPEKPPTTFQEVVDYAKKMTVPGKQYGYAIAAAAKNSPHVTSSLAWPIWGHGGAYMNKDWTKSTINEPKAVAGVQWHADLFLKHKCVPDAIMSYDMNDEARLLGAGTVAMTWAGFWGRGNIEETAPPNLDYRVTFPPPEKVTTFSGWKLCIPKNSDNPDEAWKFIEWFGYPPNLLKYTIRTPTAKDALTDAKWGTERNLPHLKNAEFGRNKPLIPEWAEMEKFIADGLHEVLLKRATAQEAMDKVAEKMDALLK